MSGSIPSVEERQIKADSESDTLLSLENLIKNHVESINKLKVELKTQREMFEDSFNSNPKYREQEDKVKSVTKEKNSIRAEILKQPSVAMLSQKIKDIRFDMTEQQKTLSDLLVDYQEQTKATQLELFDGSVFEMVKSVKLVKAR